MWARQNDVSILPEPAQKAHNPPSPSPCCITLFAPFCSRAQLTLVQNDFVYPVVCINTEFVGVLLALIILEAWRKLRLGYIGICLIRVAPNYLRGSSVWEFHTIVSSSSSISHLILTFEVNMHSTISILRTWSHPGLIPRRI